MSGKQVNIGPEPDRRTVARAEAWVHESGDKTSKRLTIDMPAGLHARIKARCAMRGVNMRSAILELLNERFPE